MKILTVVGARPQFIKAAPVCAALRKARIREAMVHTGQHYDTNMSEVFFRELGIRAPKHNLGIGSGAHGQQTGRMLEKLEQVMLREKPDTVLIYGDTNSTLAGALAAAKLHIPVAHVEAGLRSFNRQMPEEINRITADHLSTLLFCPTKAAVANLKKEGISKRVHKTGDVMYDAALRFGKKAARTSKVLADCNLQAGNYILATVHRAENTDERKRLTGILTALATLARKTPVIVPLHPRTRKMIAKFKLKKLTDSISIVEPVGFLDLVQLERNARLIMTDSGGMQKEAYFHRVPCVTLREQTEWVETVKAGWNRMVNVSAPGNIVREARKQMATPAPRKKIGEYGTGNSGEKIVHLLKRRPAG